MILPFGGKKAAKDPSNMSGPPHIAYGKRNEMSIVVRVVYEIIAYIYLHGMCHSSSYTFHESKYSPQVIQKRYEVVDPRPGDRFRMKY